MALASRRCVAQQAALNQCLRCCAAALMGSGSDNVTDIIGKWVFEWVAEITKGL